jgi:hypothetical protein
MELKFRRRGDANAPIRVHRHIAANLANNQFRGSGVQKHLEAKGAKGSISALTKAASYLLWHHSFSEIRKYLLAHMAFMVSDSTGIPPHLARRAGFTQTTYGVFKGAFLEGDRPLKTNDAFIDLWDKQRKRRLPFRYGYPDSEGNFHMMITAPKRPRTKAKQ